MPLSRTLLTAAALAAAAAAPSAANAAEGFTAVTSDGRVAHFHSDSFPSMSPKPAQVKGLASGERVVGLDRTPAGELLALTSAGRIASLDGATGKATAKFPAPVTAAVDPNAALTFAVAPDGASARIITAGRDVSINLATGAATPGAGLAFASGVQTTPALDYGPDGRLIGFAGAQGVMAAQTAPGAATLQPLAKAPFRDLEPARTTVASDGSVWTAAKLETHRYQQSKLVRYDPSTGRFKGQDGVFFFVKLAAIAADGPVADDTTAPKATISGKVLKRRVMANGRSYFSGLRVRVDEGGQTTAQLRVGGKTVGYGLITTDYPGTYKLGFSTSKRASDTLRRAAAHHRRVTASIVAHDWANNKRAYHRTLRVAG